MKYTGLLGKNIGYSKSPKIHNNYYEENNIPFFYELFDIEEKEILNFINNVKKNNIIGFNVTIPYKKVIMKYLEDVVYPADKIGAVNTVVLTESGFIGYNTDYYGFIESLRLNDINLQGKKALIVGNGGTAMCVNEALWEMEINTIHMISRNPVKAKEEFNSINNFFGLEEEVDFSQYNIIINCTPLGGENYKGVSPIKLENVNKDLILYDLNYSPLKTKFLLEGEALGARILNGELMLKLQAYKAIEIWKQHCLERRE